MATYLKTVKCGSKSYYINHSGQDVYYSTSSKTAGTTSIKGIKFRNNQLLRNEDGKVASDFDICQCIS